MDQILNVTIVQSDLIWQNKNKNFDHFNNLLSELKDLTDIIVLPEMFTTGFSMNSKELAESMDGLSVKWMKDKAQELNAVLVGSVIIEENSNFYNRLLWVYPDGNILNYDKRHLFRMADEHKFFSAGNVKLVVEYKGWKICPLVCYDLRFPVWSRNQEDFDLLIYIANWPEKRKHPWKTLLMARAMENQVYVVGVNRIGTDANEIIYSGDSVIVDPKGNILVNTEAFSESVETLTLSLKKLNDFRETFPLRMDKDEFNII